jgi:undecaprenyl diphosphate synthase
LSATLRAAIEAAEAATAQGRTLHLRVALDYSARDAIVRAAEAVASRGGGAPLSRAAFGRLLGEADHSGTPAPDVDLLVRTGGEQRLSDFLLWECAYAELHFSPRLWPDYTAQDLCDAVADFHGRERRFGGVPAAAAV